jgi:sulfate permease, SulP family
MVDVASAEEVSIGPRVRGALRDVFAGSICSILTVAYCLSYAALIFSGPLAPWLSNGIAVTFFTAAVAGAIVAWRSSVPFAVAGPDSSTSAVMAALVAAMAQRLIAAGDTQLLAPTLILMALATGITGLLLCGLGIMRAGRAIRFIPYPVIGGFMAATGWVMVMGAVGVITGHKPALGNLESFATTAVVAQLAAGLAVAVVLQLLLMRWQSPFILPGVLLAGIAAGHLGVAFSDMSIAQAQAAGWYFQPPAPAPLILPWHSEALAAFPWRSLPFLVGDVLAVMFVTVISMLLNTTGVEIATRREADIERELNALGLASLLSAAFGGYVSSLSLSRTSLNYSLGGRSRLSGLTVAAISALMLVVNPGFLGFVPKFALGGLLFFAGARLLHRWIVQSAGQLTSIEYLSLLAVALIIVQWGFIAGVLIGVVIGCATFAVSASRVNAIKFSFDGSEYRSRLDRSAEELAILARHGRELQGMALQSYLFFGSANRLYQHVKALLRERPECRFLVFDFRLVTGMDSSATHSFSQIKQVADESGARVVLVHLKPDLERAFQAIRLLSGDVVTAADLDRALETCEDAVIAAHRGESSELDSLRGWLGKALGSEEYAEALAAACHRFEVAPGEIVARQGEPSNSMHFILDGRVGIVVDMGDGHAVRVRSLGRHTTIGEMGLISGRPRSATIQAEAPSVLYELSLERFNELKRERPTLGQVLLSYVISVMAERLSFASRVIGVLQR